MRYIRTPIIIIIIINTSTYLSLQGYSVFVILKSL
jgi:hypothetical protein